MHLELQPGLLRAGRASGVLGTRGRTQQDVQGHRRLRRAAVLRPGFHTAQVELAERCSCKFHWCCFAVAGSASGWWSCTRAGDRCLPAPSGTHLVAPGKADNLNSAPSQPPRPWAYWWLFFVLVWFLGPCVIYCFAPGGRSQGH